MPESNTTQCLKKLRLVLGRANANIYVHNSVKHHDQLEPKARSHAKTSRMQISHSIHQWRLGKHGQLLLLLHNVRPLVLLLAKHNSLQPRLDLGGVAGRLAIGSKSADIGVVVTDHSHGSNKVLESMSVPAPPYRERPDLQQCPRQRTQQCGPPEQHSQSHQ